MGDEYEQLKKCFDIEKIKNSNLMNEINTIKEKLTDNNSTTNKNQNQNQIQNHNQNHNQNMDKDKDKEKDKYNLENNQKQLYYSPDYNNNNNNSIKKQSTLNLQNKEGIINGSFLSSNENKSNPFCNNNISNNNESENSNSNSKNKINKFYKKETMDNYNFNNNYSNNYNYNTNPISRTPLANRGELNIENKSPLNSNMNINYNLQNLIQDKNDISTNKESGNIYPKNKNLNLNLNLTQIDENKGIFNLENKDKLNDMYLKKVKSSKNLINVNNNLSPSPLLNLTQTGNGNIFSDTINVRENLMENTNNFNHNTNNNLLLQMQMQTQNMSTYREGRSVYLNFGRLCDDRDDRDRSKSPRLINQNNLTNISHNKGVIKNIETNVK
jgi:hypothetical protein